VLSYVLDEEEFLSPYGIRSLSKRHAAQPVTLELAGQLHSIDYEPAESRTGLFGGNSNWRGPVWFPINYLLVESLQKFHRFLGDDVKVALPTGSDNLVCTWDVARELSQRLVGVFLPDGSGDRPINGGDPRHREALWREHVTFPEYLHGDTGAALGASHQTGWTALVARLISQTSAEPSRG
jgi:hypothetical protein